MKAWFDDFDRLELLNGRISFLLEDDEDMIEILYEDGLLIDVGYIEKLGSYYITVVSDDDWTNPIEEMKVDNKKDLPERLQETIYKYRCK